MGIYKILDQIITSKIVVSRGNSHRPERQNISNLKFEPDI